MVYVLIDCLNLKNNPGNKLEFSLVCVVQAMGIPINSNLDLKYYQKNQNF